MKRSIQIVAVLLVLTGAGYGVWRWRQNHDDQPAYRTAKIERGDLTRRVSATGTINPLVNVQVGSQVSGIIAKLCADFNSKVKAGDLLAELDPTLFLASLKQTEGDYLSAKANLAKAKLALDRAQELFDKKIGPQSERDDAQASHEAALGALKRAEGAKLKAEADLAHTKIYSPVDGIVTSRAVDVGQTVAASLSAPTLFTIAKDLTQMQINTSVDEADIGQVQDGQHARFTVDAYPGETFRGQVVQVRNQPQVVQNVVTYDVIVSVDNSDLKLKPGMTANVYITVAEAEDVLKLPNAALRFQPVATTAASTNESSDQPRSRRGPRQAKGTPLTTASGNVWLLAADNKPQKVAVELGLNDGQHSEVKNGLTEGQTVIVGYAGNVPKDKTAQSPFGSPLGGGMRRF